MVSGSMDSGTVIGPLDFDVVLLPAIIHGQRIQANGSCTNQTFHIRLSLHRKDGEAVVLKQDPQHLLGQWFVVPENTAHKIIVNGPQQLESVQIFLPLSQVLGLSGLAHCLTLFLALPLLYLMRTNKSIGSSGESG
jgi:hypothetical protein